MYLKNIIQGDLAYEKILSVLFIAVLALSSSLTGYAKEDAGNGDVKSGLTENETEMLMEQLATMSNDELNEYIDEIARKYEEDSLSSRSITVPETSLESAWLAAAQIAYNSGFQCAGLIVNHSVRNLPYVATNMSTNSFYTKVSATSVYRNYVTAIKNGNSVPTSFAFTSSMNRDLYYAMHRVNIAYSTMGTGILKTYNIVITDTFDFEFERYDSLFSTLVNNWGWLSQRAGALHPISITLGFTEA